MTRSFRTPRFHWVLAAALGMACAAAHAEIRTNVPGGPAPSLAFASLGNAPSPGGDSPKVGQLFSWGQAADLTSLSFYALGNVAAPLQLSVATWNPGSTARYLSVNTISADLLETSAAFGSYDAAQGLTTFSFADLGLRLEAGATYVAYLSAPDPSTSGVQLARTQTKQDASGFGAGFAYLSATPGSGWQFPFNGNGFLSLQYSAGVTAAVPEPAAPALGLLGAVAVALAVRRQGRRPSQS